jgi:hypothetical protein
MQQSIFSVHASVRNSMRQHLTFVTQHHQLRATIPTKASFLAPSNVCAATQVHGSRKRSAKALLLRKDLIHQCSSNIFCRKPDTNHIRSRANDVIADKSKWHASCDDLRSLDKRLAKVMKLCRFAS